MNDDLQDCLIIGGGPAGLTTAIYCARFLLTTTVVDAGGGRASRIPRTHNHAGYPGGIPGRELLDLFRRQAIENGANIEQGYVSRLVRTEDGFDVAVGDRVYQARTVLLATGITDRRPDMDDGLHDQTLEAGLVRYCPICDGFEVRDRNIAVIGTGDHGAREAVFLRSYSRRVSLIAPEGVHALSDAARAELSSLSVDVVDGPATDFAIDGRTLRLSVPSGSLAFEAAYPALGAEIHSKLAVSLGADAREGGCLIVDDHARTTVPGLYAAGDVVLGLDQISGAMGQAALAATTMRNDLAERERRLR